ncbi:MAG: hypothetical protein IPJ98_17295 [Bryobacterales bacterium]|nr:hypothetical protein [Bryobacterales bacterium]
MACALEEIFGDLAAQVPDGPPDDAEFIFHTGVLPAPPSTISTDRILLYKAHHDYNGWYKADALWMYLTPRKCRELGLLLLAAGFHGPVEDTAILLTHPDSAIKRIVIRASGVRLDDPPVGLSMVPFALRYYPSETRRHPWKYDCNASELPVFALSNAEDCVGPSDEEWAKRDTIWIEMSAGMFRFAELLLNAGCSWNEVRDYALEGEAGYRSVGPMSAELQIFLPGSDGWLFQDEDVPSPNRDDS